MQLHNRSTISNTFLSVLEWVVREEECRTPSLTKGACKSIYNCPAMINFLERAPRPLSQAARDILRNYQCGFEGQTVKICCNNDPIEIGSKQPVNPVSNIPQPPDVSGHRNLPLLPVNCGPLPYRNRIIGGNKTNLFEFPWMALLSYSNGGTVKKILS